MSTRSNSVGGAFQQGHSHADEAFYRAAAAHLHDIVTVTDRYGIVIFMGGAAANILGGRPPEHLARRLLDITHPDDRATLEKHLEALIRADASTLQPPVEYRLATAAGGYRWIESVTRNLLDDPAVNGVILIGRDITSRKQGELALRDSEIRLNTTMWATQIGFWELDFNTDKTVWLNNWCEALGLDPCDGNDHVDRWDSRIHPDDIAVARGAFSNHVAGVNSFYEAEYRILDANGAWQWIRERGRVVARDDAGRALKMVGTCMDINPRRAAEDALRLCQAAMQAMAATVPEALLQLDAILTIRSASRAVGDVSIQAMTGRPFVELAGAEERAQLAQALMGVLNDQRAADFTIRVGGPSRPALRARATPIVVANQATGVAVSVFPARPVA
ncbi:MAG TPA: PAS domain-containing protein [Steroidobacteraceae bacterium]|nr:PAS domain-containing protein [Steroidobacteraceae bacterium]